MLKTSLSYQLSNPDGFWVHADNFDFCKRFPALRAGCGPSDENGTAPAVAAPVVPGPGVRIPKKSNLDLNGRLVKRGLLVSWGGLRFKVLRIEGGRAYYGDSFSNAVACGLVQVVV